MTGATVTRVSDRVDGELWRWPDQSVVDKREWRWPNFTPQEMACRESGIVLIRPSFMDELQNVRNRLNLPMLITSGYRSPGYNAKVSASGCLEGPHVSAQAVDIHVKGLDAFNLVDLAIQFGFTGIGIRQHGNLMKRFVHLDRWSERVSSRIWTYDQLSV